MFVASWGMRMRITLGKRGGYAVRAVLYLATHRGGGLRKTREIANAMRIPLAYLPQILAELVRAELLVATAGRDGGYQLARHPSAISLLQVVEAAEGPVDMLHSCLLRDIPCGTDGYCAAHESWAGAQDALARKLRATSFADLVRKSASLSVSPAQLVDGQ